MDAVSPAMLAAAPNDDIRAAVKEQLDYLASLPTNAATLRIWLTNVIQWASAHPGSRVLVGEFGVYKLRSAAADRAQWLQDVRRIAESLGWGWCVWEAHKGFGLFEGDVMNTTVLRALIDAPAPKPMQNPLISPTPPPPPCALRLGWEDLVAFKVRGQKVHTGGLGEEMTMDFAVWLCIDPALAECVTPHASASVDLACFRYHERLLRFEWIGWNSALLLV
jgi:hypothetical protein